MRSCLLVIAIAVLAGCSDAGGAGPDGSAGGTGDGGGDAAASCLGTVAQISFCDQTFADQVIGNDCNDPPNTTRMCGGGTYKLWESVFIDSTVCVYDAAGTTLVGARECGTSHFDCPSNCFTWGIAASAYADATCGAASMACP